MPHTCHRHHVQTNTLFAKLGNRVRAKPTSRAAQADLGEGREGAGGEEGGYGDAGEPGPDVPGGPADDDEHIDITAAAEPTEEEVKAEMALLFGGGAADGGAPSTIFAVTMACIDEPYEANTLQFLRHAFDAFPDKTYCVLTLPHDSPEPPLVAPFTRLAPLPGANFPEVLYLINRWVGGGRVDGAFGAGIGLRSAACMLGCARPCAHKQGAGRLWWLERGLDSQVQALLNLVHASTLPATF